MADQHITVFKTGTQFRVSPAHVQADKGDHLYWRADGGMQIAVFIPGTTPMGSNVVLPQLGKTNMNVDLVLDPAYFSSGVYPYAVYCLPDKVFAQGNSDPKIIVR